MTPRSPTLGGLRGRGLVLRHLGVRGRVRGQVPAPVSGSRFGAPAEKRPVTWWRVPRLPWRPAVSLPAARSSGGRQPPVPLSAGMGVGRVTRAAGAAGGTVPPAARAPLRVAPHVLTPQGAPFGKISQRSENQAAWGGPGSLHSCPRGRGPGPCAGRQQEQLPEARRASCAGPRRRGRLRALDASGRRAGPGRTAGAVPWPALKAASCERPPAVTESQACSGEDASRRPGPTGWGCGWSAQTF